MNKTDEHKQTSNPEIECNSPPCYAHEIDPAYLEFTSKLNAEEAPKQRWSRNQDDKTG